MVGGLLGSFGLSLVGRLSVLMRMIRLPVVIVSNDQFGVLDKVMGIPHSEALYHTLTRAVNPLAP